MNTQSVLSQTKRDFGVQEGSRLTSGAALTLSGVYGPDRRRLPAP